VRAGEKFADSDLIGIPFRVVVSDKTYASEKYELVTRATGEKRMVSTKELFALVV
jgi:prolyl-tRNA synthetase